MRITIDVKYGSIFQKTVFKKIFDELIAYLNTAKLAFEREHKKNKFNIQILNVDDNLSRNTFLNKRFWGARNIDKIAKAITYYAFRSGPIEDMHANRQLSQDDMMQLNKYTVNKIAGLLLMLKKEEWDKVDRTLNFCAKYTIGWDSAEPDTETLQLEKYIPELYKK